MQSKPLPGCHPARRDFLYGLASTLGTVAFNALLADASQPANPLAPRKPYHEAKAKSCIFLFMEGGPSHLDTFDPKPKLRDLHLREFTREDRFASAMASGKRYYVQSPFAFRKHGRAGLDICEHFEQLASVADELCVYKGLVAESIDHPTACFHMNTGNRFGGDPAVGAWVTYGLGTLNQNLPAFMVLPEVAYPQGGAQNWSNGFLPAHFQGTPLRSEGAPILDLNPPPHVTRSQQRANLDLLAKLNASDAKKHPHHSETRTLRASARPTAPSPRLSPTSRSAACSTAPSSSGPASLAARPTTGFAAAPSPQAAITTRRR